MEQSLRGGGREASFKGKEISALKHVGFRGGEDGVGNIFELFSVGSGMMDASLDVKFLL